MADPAPAQDVVVRSSFHLGPVVQDGTGEPSGPLPPWRLLPPDRVPRSSAMDRWITDLDDSLTALLLARLREE